MIFLTFLPSWVKSFCFDNFGYKHIDFLKIKKHKECIFDIYQETFSPICHKHNNAKLLFVSEKEKGNLCFFPMHFKNIDVNELILYFQERGIFIDQLWNFDKIEKITEDFKLWAKGVIVFPLNVYTNKKYIKKMAIMLKDFLDQ